MSRLCFVLLLCLLAPTVIAQTFPSKPLRIIVRASPGGADDFHARVVSMKLGEVLGQRVLVEYRPGAGGLVAWDYVAKQPADGYTLLLAASGLAAIKALRPKMPVDPWKDFTWISQIARFPLVFTIHPSVPSKNLKELIALARSRPGQLSYGSSGVGATPHLAAEYFKAAAKIDIRHIPYKGSAPMYVDLMGGRIEMGTSVAGSAIPHVNSGKLRALGVTSLTRSRQLPDVPTIAESGLRDFEFMPFYALVGPAGMPRDVVVAIADAMAKTIAAPEVRDQLIKDGSDPGANTPEQMLQLARKDAEIIGRIVRDAKITVDD